MLTRGSVRGHVKWLDITSSARKNLILEFVALGTGDEPEGEPTSEGLTAYLIEIIEDSQCFYCTVNHSDYILNYIVLIFSDVKSVTKHLYT